MPPGPSNPRFGIGAGAFTTCIAATSPFASGVARVAAAADSAQAPVLSCAAARLAIPVSFTYRTPVAPAMASKASAPKTAVAARVTVMRSIRIRQAGA